MEKQYNPVKNSHGSKVTRNPLREWRGERTQKEAATMFGLTLLGYVALETRSDRLILSSSNILQIQAVTQIPLPVLVDWLTETTKESVS